MYLKTGYLSHIDINNNNNNNNKKKKKKKKKKKNIYNAHIVKH